MKNKLIASILTLVCVCSLAACSMGTETLKNEEDATKNTETTEEMNATEETSTIEETVTTEDTATTEATIEESAEDTTSSEEATTTPVATIPSELSEDLYSFQISIDGTVYQFPMWYSDFEAMGWIYDGDATETLTSNQYTVAEKWIKDGFYIYSEFANLTMNAAPFSKCMIAGITLDDYYLEGCDWEIILPKGIQYGVSSKEDIIAAYGDPSDEYDGDLYYKLTYDYDSYQEICLFVSKETGVLNEIEIENMIELEGGDNSVDPTVPEVVTSYTAPSELGDDLYQFNMELEGNLYSLPCPVSVFLANGFTIVEDNSELEIAADGSGWLELRYNNQSFRSIVQNYADYATIVENCFVTTMESSEYEPKFALTIPGNIKRGDSEDAVLAAIEGFNYELEDSSNFKYYNVYNPEGSILERFTICVKEGVVNSIEVRNDTNPNKAQ